MIKDKHFEMISELCDIKATYECSDNIHYAVWYDDCGDLVCETNVGDDGDLMMWSCENAQEFADYCHLCEYILKATK